MKFIKQNGTELIFNEDFSVANKEVSPFKEIINRKDFSSFSFVDSETISLADTVQIQVNVIDVGVMIYLFKKDDFKKDEFIADVSKLKEMKIDSFYDVINKMKTLYEVTALYNPLFVIYNPAGKYMVFEDCFKTNFVSIKTIYISDKGNNFVVNKGKKEIEEQENKEAKKFKFFNPLPLLKKDKFHFIFALIATFLIGLTLSIAIYDAYAGKMLCIFFFICSLAGAFLNFMIYKDTLKASNIKSPFFILTAISSVIGLGISIGGYFIFKLLSKPDEGFVAPNVLILIAAMIGLYLLSFGVAFLYSFLKKRKK